AGVAVLAVRRPGTALATGGGCSGVECSCEAFPGGVHFRGLGAGKRVRSGAGTEHDGCDNNRCHSCENESAADPPLCSATGLALPQRPDPRGPFPIVVPPDDEREDRQNGHQNRCDLTHSAAPFTREPFPLSAISPGVVLSASSTCARC